MKVKVPRATLEGMGAFIASKSKENGGLKPGEAEAVLARSQDDNPDLFGEHVDRTRKARAARTRPAPDEFEGGSLHEWRNGLEASVRGDAGTAKFISGRATEIAQKAYEAIVMSAPGSMDLDQISDENMVRKWTKLHDLHDGFTIAQAVHRDFDPHTSKHWPAYARLASELAAKVMGPAVSKIMTTGGSGTGLEFIPSTMSGSLVPLIKQALVLSDMFEHVTMPASPWKLPIEGADNLPFLVSESSSDNPDDSNNAISARTKATVNTTITAKKLGVRTLVSAEEQEDAIIDAVSYARAGIARSIGEGIDAAVMNGDDLGSLDVDSAGASDPRRAWKGLRKLVATGASVDALNAALTAQKFVNLLTKFGKFAQVIGDTAFVVSPIGYAQLCGDTAFNRYDAHGGVPPVVTGQIGDIFGRPVVISGYVREDLNHVGSYDGSGTTKTVAIAVHRPSFKMWDRRLVTIKSAELIQSDRVVLVALWRGFFGRLQPESSSPLARNVAGLYNINKNATF
jgi:HK97 family phage major capsid protein